MGELEEEEGHPAEPVMCNNLERALYLALRYHFVTPLTSLVVVKPETVEPGHITEADMFNKKIRLVSGAPTAGPHGGVLASVLLLSLQHGWQ